MKRLVLVALLCPISAFAAAVTPETIVAALWRALSHDPGGSADVATYDRFAAVYSVVESRSSRAASKPDFVGVNSIHLYRFGEEWRIVSLYYHLATDGLPVSLDDGQSGKCID